MRKLLRRILSRLFSDARWAAIAVPARVSADAAWACIGTERSGRGVHQGAGDNRLGRAMRLLKLVERHEPALERLHDAFARFST